MKVIIVNRYFHPDQSATSRMATSLAAGLQGRGWTVHVISGRCLHNEPARTLPAIEMGEHGITIHRIWTSSWGRTHLVGRAMDYVTFHMAACWRLFLLARRGDICIICTDPPLLSVTALLPLQLRGAVLVNWLLDLFPEVAMELEVAPKEGLLSKAALALRDLSLRKARWNVAPIRRMAGYLTQRGIPRTQMTVIHHWSQGDGIWPVEPALNTLRREWGLSEEFVVGYSGNLGRAHEFETVLQAARRLAGSKDIVFLFVGGGYQRQRVEDRIRELKLPNVIMKPLQPKERLAECLGVADIHLVSLLPALEPCIVPSKFYGIAAAGRPTFFIGDENGEVASLIERGNCGKSFRIGDAEGLAEAVLTLKSSPRLWSQMGLNARRLFETEFSDERGIADWQALLQRPVTVPAPTAGTIKAGNIPN